MNVHETGIKVLNARRNELLEKLEINANEGGYYHRQSEKYANEARELETRIQSVASSIMALGGTVEKEVAS